MKLHRVFLSPSLLLVTLFVNSTCNVYASSLDIQFSNNGTHTVDFSLQHFDVASSGAEFNESNSVFSATYSELSSTFLATNSFFFEFESPSSVFFKFSDLSNSDGFIGDGLLSEPSLSWVQLDTVPNFSEYRIEALRFPTAPGEFAFVELFSHSTVSQTSIIFRPGDSFSVPLPASISLISTGLLCLMGFYRNNQASKMM